MSRYSESGAFSNHRELMHVMRDHYSLRTWFWIGALINLLWLGLLTFWYAGLHMRMVHNQTDIQQHEQLSVTVEQRILVLEKDKQAREDRAKRIMEEQRRQEELKQKGKMP